MMRVMTVFVSSKHTPRLLKVNVGLRRRTAVVWCGEWPGAVSSHVAPGLLKAHPWALPPPVLGSSAQHDGAGGEGSGAHLS